MVISCVNIPQTIIIRNKKTKNFLCATYKKCYQQHYSLQVSINFSHSTFIMLLILGKIIKNYLIYSNFL